MRSLLTFMLLAAAITPAPVLAGPFGYEMGQAIPGEPDGQAANGFFYQISPKEFAGWGMVAAYYTHETGVCAIKAYKFVSNGNAYGDDHRRAADILVETLTKKYGAFEKYDYLRRGSILGEPSDWVKAIGKRERRYYYVNKDPLEGDLDGIAVDIHSFGLELLYDFNNFDVCEEAASEAALSDL